MAEPKRTKTGVILHDWSKTNKSWSSLDRGLDLSEPDFTTIQEVEAWRQHDRDYRGYPMPTYNVLIELGRPDAVKRWFSQIPRFYANEGGFSSSLLFTHLYAITGFTEGTLYEIDNAESQRHTKDDVAEALALAFLHAPSGHGFFAMRAAINARMERYSDPETPRAYPEGWEPDPGFFHAGLDFSVADCTAAEVGAVRAWYDRVAGEIPGWVEFLGTHKPNLLKAYRNRFENTVKVLPKQMMPWLLLSWETHRGYGVAIREAVLMCRGFGVTRTQAVDAITWGMLYGGHGSMSNVQRAAGDILDESW